MTIDFDSPEPDENKKMWALRLAASDHKKMEDLGVFWGKGKTDVIRHLIRQAHKQLLGSAAHPARQSPELVRRKEEIKRRLAELKRKKNEEDRRFDQQIKGLENELGALN